MHKIYFSLNAKTREVQYEQNHKPSMTEPDQSLTVRQIIERSQRGLLPKIVKQPLFTEDSPDLRHQDITERTETIDRVRNLEKEHKNKVDNVKRKLSERTRTSEPIIQEQAKP